MIYNSSANQLPNQSLARYHNRYSACNVNSILSVQNHSRTNEITKRLAFIQSPLWRTEIWFKFCLAKTAETSHFTNIIYTLMLQQQAQEDELMTWGSTLLDAFCLWVYMLVQKSCIFWFKSNPSLSLSLILHLTHKLALLPPAGNRNETCVLKMSWRGSTGN